MSENEDIEKENIEGEQAELDSTKEPEEEHKEEPGEERVKPKRRGLSSKRNKILIVVAIVVIAVIIGLWGAAPDPYRTVKEVVENSDSFIGDEIDIRGKVGNWSHGQNFTLVDDNNASLAIHVVHQKAIPEGFAVGKDVVVKGRLENGENGLTIKSTNIQVGCPSKY